MVASDEARAFGRFCEYPFARKQQRQDVVESVHLEWMFSTFGTSIL